LGTGGIFELNVIGFVLVVIAAVLLIGGRRGRRRQEQEPRLRDARLPALACAVRLLLTV